MMLREPRGEGPSREEITKMAPKRTVGKAAYQANTARSHEAAASHFSSMKAAIEANKCTSCGAPLRAKGDGRTWICTACYKIHLAW